MRASTVNIMYSEDGIFLKFNATRRIEFLPMYIKTSGVLGYLDRYGIKVGINAGRRSITVTKFEGIDEVDITTNEVVEGQINRIIYTLYHAYDNVAFDHEISIEYGTVIRNSNSFIREVVTKVVP